MGNLARKLFEELIAAEVHKLGPIVSRHQPFLVCRPDEVIINGNDFDFLEIKYPATCEKAKIVGREEQRRECSLLVVRRKRKFEIEKSHATRRKKN